jgi:hypothetical protein
MSEAVSFYYALQRSTEGSAYMSNLKLLCTQTESRLLELRQLLLDDTMAWRPWIWQENTAMVNAQQLPHPHIEA